MDTTKLEDYNIDPAQLNEVLDGPPVDQSVHPAPSAAGEASPTNRKKRAGFTGNKAKKAQKTKRLMAKQSRRRNRGQG